MQGLQGVCQQFGKKGSLITSLPAVGHVRQVFIPLLSLSRAGSDKWNRPFFIRYRPVRIEGC